MAASRLLSTVQSAPKRGRQGSFGGRIGPFVHASHKEDSSTLAEARICEAGFMAKKNRRYPEKKKNCNGNEFTDEAIAKDYLGTLAGVAN